MRNEARDNGSFSGPIRAPLSRPGVSYIRTDTVIVAVVDVSDGGGESLHVDSPNEIRASEFYRREIARGPSDFFERLPARFFHTILKL